jgi:membrane protease YdiL (CAAX protease family)
VRPEKPWQVELVGMLIIGLSFSILASAGAIGFLKQSIPGLRPDAEKFYSFLISSVFFQGVSIALLHVFLRQHGVRWAEFLGLPHPDWTRAVAIGVLTGIVVVPAALGLKKLSEMALHLFDAEAATQLPLQVLQVAGSVPQRIAFGIGTIVLAPLVEELLFRGVAYKAIRERGYPRLALAFSSLLFGIIHVNVPTLVPLTAFAIVLGLLYERTGTLLAPIAAHAMFNAINFGLFLYSAK